MVPQAKVIAKDLGRHVVKHGINEAQDVLAGRKSVKSALKNVAKNAPKDVLMKKLRGGKRKRAEKLYHVSSKCNRSSNAIFD